MNAKKFSKYQLQQCDDIYAICVFNLDTWQYESIFKGKKFDNGLYYNKNGRKCPVIGLETETEKRVFWLQLSKDQAEDGNSFDGFLEYTCKKEEGSLKRILRVTYKFCSVLKKSGDSFTLVFYDEKTDALQEFALQEELRIKGIPEKCFAYFDGDRLVIFDSCTYGLCVYICKCSSCIAQKETNGSVKLAVVKNGKNEVEPLRPVWDEYLADLPAFKE